MGGFKHCLYLSLGATRQLLLSTPQPRKHSCSCEGGLHTHAQFFFEVARCHLELAARRCAVRCQLYRQLRSGCFTAQLCCARPRRLPRRQILREIRSEDSPRAIRWATPELRWLSARRWRSSLRAGAALLAIR